MRSSLGWSAGDDECMHPRPRAGAIAIGGIPSPHRRSAVQGGGTRRMAKVLLKALDILALFDHNRPEWAEHEVARELELPTSTAHRLLASLRSRGYVVRTRSGSYRLGPAAMALGRRASDGPLAPGLHAALERVAAETGETAVVGIRDPAGGGLLILDQLESRQRLRLALEIGYIQPLHAGAASKALLAHLEPHEIEDVLTEPIPR